MMVLMRLEALACLGILWFLGCTQNGEFIGKYSGILAMEDGTSQIELTLAGGGSAILSGFHDALVEGEWKQEKVGEAKRDGIWATFELPEYRIRFELETESSGLRIERISMRKKGKTVLRTLRLKKSHPLLSREKE